MEKRIIIVTGETSGDLQASLLAKKLKELDSTLKITAIGGELLENAGAEIIYDIKDISVMGIFDALRKIGEFKRLMRLILKKIREIQPQAVILVDFSGFNLRLARNIHSLISEAALRPKIIYYISPQVWASRPGRIRTIKKFIDKMIVIFKFEAEFYRRFGLDVEFVGYPLLEIIKPSASRQDIFKAYGLEENIPVFACLPGSRVSEIKRILPIMLESAKLIQERLRKVQFIISKPKNISGEIYRDIVSRLFLRVKIIEARQYDCLNIADFVLVASGTATLETAVMQKPNVIIYKTSLLNYLLYRPLIKIPFIGMENIVAGKEIAPEFIQFRAKPALIAKRALEIFQDKNKLGALKEDFLRTRERLGGAQDPALRAAESVLTFINSKTIS